MKKNLLLKPILTVVGLLGGHFAMAQCPTITCPGNMNVNNTPGTCGATVTYTAPIGTNPCAVPVSQTFNYTGGMQTYTVPAGVTSISIEARGAQGGNSGGLGASMKGDFAVAPGNQLKVLVGQQGGIFTNTQVGGGGGSFVTTNANVPLCIAGGGGGKSNNPGSTPGINANITTGANNGYSALNMLGNPSDQYFGIGGVNGNGATNGPPALGFPHAGNGGGFYTDGAAGYCGLPGLSFLNGGAGGGGCSGGAGGYGGGGSGGNSGGGGGGGYSGGGGSYHNPTNGGGGGSYNAGTNQVNTAGFQNGNGQVIISYTVSPTTTRTAGLASGSIFPVGVTTNTFTVNDGLGNTANCSFTVTVTDNENPVITAPANITVNNDAGTCGAVVNFNAPAGTDNCAVTTALTAGLASGSTFPVGTTTQTYVATDASGNTGTATFTVTVTDDENPVITAPANITVNNDAGLCGAVVNFNAPVGTDNCAVTTALTAGLASGSTFPVGTTTQTYVATDASGNTATASFSVTVTDNELPVVTVPATVTSCNPVVTNIAPVATDNCSVVSVTYALTGATTGNGNTDASGSTFNTGITIVTYTATDVNGNVNSSSFNVVVNVSYNNNATASICQGKSILLGGAQQTQAGTYVDQYTTALGCDSIITTVLTVNPLPTVNLAAFVTDSVCVTVAPIALPAGTPSGGSYSGLGVVGNNFNPNAAGVGIRTIVYTYADANGCQNSDSTKITVLLCTGIDENVTLQPVVYPNPANEQVTINLGATYKAVEVSVLELNGRVIMTNRYNYTNKVTSDISGLSTGMYFLQIKADGQNTMVKVVKN